MAERKIKAGQRYCCVDQPSTVWVVVETADHCSIPHAYLVREDDGVTVVAISLSALRNMTLYRLVQEG